MTIYWLNGAHWQLDILDPYGLRRTPPSIKPLRASTVGEAQAAHDLGSWIPLSELDGLPAADASCHPGSFVIRVDSGPQGRFSLLARPASPNDGPYTPPPDEPPKEHGLSPQPAPALRPSSPPAPPGPICPFCCAPSYNPEEHQVLPAVGLCRREACSLWLHDRYLASGDTKLPAGCSFPRLALALELSAFEALLWLNRHE
jgi:hypothetical protein